MMKFFRKHNKKLLAVFMALLMIVFIGGSALEGMITPRMSSPVGTSKYGRISSTDIQKVKESVTNILEFTGRDWKRPFSLSSKELAPLDWMLLVKEGESMGIHSSVSELRASAAGQESLDQVSIVAQRLGIRADAVEKALAEYRAVQNAALAIGAAAFPSEAEVQVAARDALEKVRLRAVVIPAAAFVELQAEPSEEELQEQFEKYRAAERGEGLEFGYFRQPSARVQYVKIDRDAIAEQIGVANQERRAKEFFDKSRKTHLPFKRHAGNFPEPPETSEEVEDPDRDEYLTWEEAQHIAVAVIKRQHADRAAADLANWIVQDAMGRWLDAPRGDSGYKVAREDERNLAYFDEVLKRVPPSLNFEGAISVQTTDYFTYLEAEDVPELGTARFEPDNGPAASFRSLISLSEAFIPKIPEDAGSRETEFLSLYQTCPRPLRGGQRGNFYVFRVIEAAAGRPANSLDEVREQVAADVKLQRAYEASIRRAESIGQCAKDDGLKEAFDADEEAKFHINKSNEPGGFYEPLPFARVPLMMASRGRSPAGIYAGAGVGRLENDAVDQIFAIAESKDKRGIIEVPDRATVMFIQVDEIIRAVEDEFNELKGTLSQQLAESRWREAVASWLDPEQIRARNGFQEAVR